jgi:hypothetical protein
VGQCAFCKADAELADPAELLICAKCSTDHQARHTCPVSAQEIRLALIRDLVDATVREKAASDEFNTAIGQFPSGLPHPDGSQFIQNASCKLIAARKDMGRAHSRLNDFLDRGIIPADLAGQR